MSGISGNWHTGQSGVSFNSPSSFRGISTLLNPYHPPGPSVTPIYTSHLYATPPLAARNNADVNGFLPGLIMSPRPYSMLNPASYLSTHPSERVTINSSRAPVGQFRLPTQVPLASAALGGDDQGAGAPPDSSGSLLGAPPMSLAWRSPDLGLKCSTDARVNWSFNNDAPNALLPRRALAESSHNRWRMCNTGHPGNMIDAYPHLSQYRVRMLGSPITLQDPAPMSVSYSEGSRTSTPKPAHTPWASRSQSFNDVALDLSRLTSESSCSEQTHPVDLTLKRASQSDACNPPPAKKPRKKKSRSGGKNKVNKGAAPDTSQLPVCGSNDADPETPHFERDTEKFDHLLKGDVNCPVCDMVFRRSLLAFEMHLYRHTRARPYYCYRCVNATFPSSFHLKIHQRLPHTMPGFRDFEVYNCGVCMVSCQTMEEYDFHLDTCVRAHESSPETSQKEMKKKKSKSKKINKKEKLAMKTVAAPRMLGENGLQQLACQFCPKIFPSSNALARHIGRAHQGGTSGFPCPECDKGFSSYYNLVIHSRIHTGVKPYSCPMCGEKFRVKCTMKSHLAKCPGDAAAVPQNENDSGRASGEDAPSCESSAQAKEVDASNNSECGFIPDSSVSAEVKSPLSILHSGTDDNFLVTSEEDQPKEPESSSERERLLTKFEAVNTDNGTIYYRILGQHD